MTVELTRWKTDIAQLAGMLTWRLDEYDAILIIHYCSPFCGDINGNEMVNNQK